MRLDIYLTEKGMARSRTYAKKLIESGCVFIGGAAITKSSYEVADTDEVSVADDNKYVSRGAYKLLGALDAFQIEVDGLAALDVGASTGGFTDVLLQSGARLVYALDCGTGQLAQKLLNDPRVISMENCNARYITKDMFGMEIDIAVMDVSFISQKLILPSLYAVLREGGTLVTLIKPQFEVGKGAVGKGGIVKDARARERAVSEVLDFARVLGFTVVSHIESPICGGDGNIEYLAYFRKGSCEL